jgi:hypothetical protein
VLASGDSIVSTFMSSSSIRTCVCDCNCGRVSDWWPDLQRILIHLRSMLSVFYKSHKSLHDTFDILILLHSSIIVA